MKLSRTVDYALRATILLAQEEPNRPIPCSHLASEGEMPERFLLQILRSLVNEGLLRSTRGVDGGYTLAQSPTEVSVLNIIEAIEGPLHGTSIDAGANNIQRASAERLSDALQEVSNALRRELNAIKIASLLPPPEDAD